MTLVPTPSHPVSFLIVDPDPIKLFYDDSQLAVVSMHNVHMEVRRFKHPRWTMRGRKRFAYHRYRPVEGRYKDSGRASIRRRVLVGRVSRQKDKKNGVSYRIRTCAGRAQLIARKVRVNLLNHSDKLTNFSKIWF